MIRPPSSRAPLRPPDSSLVRFFPTAAERTRQAAIARSQGDIEGEIAGLVSAGFLEEEARDLVKQKYERAARGGTATPFQSVAGQMPDGTPAFGVFDRAGGVYRDSAGELLVGFQPRTTTGSTSMGAEREAIARAEYGKPFAQLSQEEQQAVLAQETARAGERAATTTAGRMGAASAGPLSSAQRAQETRQLVQEWDDTIEPIREMTRQHALMKVGLERYPADPIGGSQAVLVTFQKILDPDSVVRESEYARSPSGLPIFSRLQGMYDRYIGQWDPDQQKWVGGGAGVPQAELAEMVKTAESFLAAMEGHNDQKARQIAQRAELAQIDPAMILGDAYSPAPTPPGPDPTPANQRQVVPPTETPGSGSQMPGTGQAPGIPDTVPAGAPQVGQFVGNPLTPGENGQFRDVEGNPVTLLRSPSTGGIYARKADGSTVPVIERDGQYYEQ